MRSEQSGEPGAAHVMHGLLAVRSWSIVYRGVLQNEGATLCADRAPS